MGAFKLILSLLSFPTVYAALDGSRYMWFTQPGRWPIFEDAIPIGNGRVAAAIYGGATEILGINENSIWTGPYQNRTPTNATENEPIVRNLLLNGNISQGNDLTMRQMIPKNNSPRGFSYFGNIVLDFGHNLTEMSNYTRWLDTKQGTSGVNYTVGGIHYTREYIASYPHGILMARFTASESRALNVNITMNRTRDVESVNAAASEDNNTVTLMGTSGQAADEDPILWTGQARFVLDDGAYAPFSSFQTLVASSAEASGSTLTIQGATSIDMYFDVETNFRYSTQAGWEGEMRRKINDAFDTGYNEVKTSAIADVSELLNRVEVDLGTSPNGWADLPTDERIAIARSNSSDVQLTVLVFNFGRHLLVASSRLTDNNGKSLPANLQGIWNNSTDAPWGGKYTININIEMNYWPAGPTNLVETQYPLFDLMDRANLHGQALALAMYGCPGTVFHHNLDMWGDPAPTDNYTKSTMWPMGAAWLSWHMMDQYRFTGDKRFLRDVAYPFLVDVATFYECYTLPYEGNNVTGPSLSPENSFQVPSYFTIAGSDEPMDIAPSMDGQLLNDVFSNLIEAAEILGIDDDTVIAAREFLPTIRPQYIGSLGQILEWRIEYAEPSPGQKHLSPLWALMPGKQFSPLVNTTLSAAAEVLLDRRVKYGSGTTGWSRTWLMSQFNRLFRGDDAWTQLTEWFAVYPTPYNLYNTNQGPVGSYQFQIDGNFGFVIGVTEMFLQSHAGITHLLPALPSALPKGSVRGLLSRGNFVVDIAWESNLLTRAVITSRNGGDLIIRCANGSAIHVNGKPYEGTISTSVNERYIVTLA